MKDSLIVPLVGAISPAVAVVLSYQEQLEYWLRILSLVGGIAVAVVTIYKMLKVNK